MNRHEFATEMQEVLKVFEKNPAEQYLNILARKLEDVTISEFRAMKMRAFEECEHFPKISKWVHLANWIKDKRESRPHLLEAFKNCEVCLSTGFIHVQVGASKTLVKCVCELSDNWPVEGMPTLEQVRARAKIIPWILMDFKPSADHDIWSLAEGFGEMVNIARQYWAYNGV
jgi:hypothetical protein